MKRWIERLFGSRQSNRVGPQWRDDGGSTSDDTAQPGMEGIAEVYDLSGLSEAERARAAQLEDLFGFPFPSELFRFWRWHQGLTEAQKAAFSTTLGMRLVGPFDVLRGLFDDVDLAYPAILHWRFQYDPPEFVTIMSGDTDGLHWGLWFDDHARLPPVVAGYYARDAFEITEYGSSLFEMLNQHMAFCREGIAENIEYDPDYKEEYLAGLRDLDDLETTLPVCETCPARSRVVQTGEGMGIVPPAVGGSAACEQLLRGKEMWIRDPRKAGPILEQAYLLADRPVLASIVAAHTLNPVLPKVDVLEYPRGSYHSLEQAMAEPEEVRLLGLADAGLSELPDLSMFTNLEELSVYGNRIVDLPASLGTCQKLKRINLFRNPLTTVPDVLFELPRLEQVILGNGVPEDELDRLRKALPKAEVR